jgi:DNA (cytosine-5)-methyltransferase 1
MRYGSVCSGIEAATVAWHSLGWGPAFFSEIEKFPREVLAHHYPEVPLHGDFTTIGENQYGSIDLLVGGTPCQSFSVAGLRKGLDDERGNLSLEFIKLAQRERPRWVVWENVPGVLSSNGGKDFGSFLGALGEIGYGFAYRVLDAQYFGVAQRRRRVFVVGYFGDWRRAAAVLFERESLRGNPAPSRKKGQKPAPALTAGPPFSRTGNDRVECDAYVSQIVGPLTRASNAGGTVTHQDISAQHLVTARMRPECDAYIPEVMATINATDAEKWGSNQWVNEGKARDYIDATDLVAIALAENTIGRKPMNGGNGDGFTEGGPMYTLNATGVHGVAAFQQNTRDEVRYIGGDGKIAGALAASAGMKQTNYIQIAIPINTMTVQGRPSDDLNPRMGLGIGEPGDPCPTITSAHSHAVAQSIPFGVNEKPDVGHCLRSGASKADKHESTTYVAYKATGESSLSDVTMSLTASYGAGGADLATKPLVCGMAVRRLTPTECERLQGFPDGYTNIKDKCPDGPRYKALGNSMAVPVMKWIGERIQMVEDHG